ncbi:MAG TPA: hypothetical protein VN903_28175 [Polyangia bacterium]|nr:hypothetical protein [Polyangia bacterium]
MKVRLTPLALCAAAIAWCVTGCSSPRGEATAKQIEALTQSRAGDAPAVELTVRAGGRSEDLILSAIGSIAQIEAEPSAGAGAVKAVVDYRTGQVLIEHITDQTYSATTITEYVTQQQPALSSEGATEPLPKPTVRRTDLETQIAGLAARAYLATSNGTTTRLWYAEDLPLPPPSVRQQLAAIGPVAAEESGGSDGGTLPPSDDDNDDDRQGDRGQCARGDHGPVTPEELAGRTILRTESQDATGRWTIINDTLAARRTRLAPQDLAVPAGFTVVPLPSLPPAVNQAFSDPLACSASGDPSTHLPYNGGDTLHDIHVYVNYFGPGFETAFLADPTGFDSVFTAGLSRAFTSSYLNGLQQYGVRSGEVVQTRIFPLAPPDSFNNKATDVATVMGLETAVVPSLWWRTDKFAPLVFLVFDDSVSPSSSGAGYHLAAPSNPWVYLPFPINLAANPLIPFAVVVMPGGALSVTAAALGQRDQANCGGSSCGPIQALDEGTQALSHELVEAITDPFPFSGWANIFLFPAWLDGEIADICDSACKDGTNSSRITRVGNTVLSTYWSNSVGACVPAWPRIAITIPSSGSEISLASAAAGVFVEASVSNPIDQGVRLGTAVDWSVDGKSAGLIDALARGTDVSSTIIIFGGGSHTITARYYSASDSITINVRDQAPVVVIDSPADGTTVPVGTTITLTGHGTSVDHPDGIPGGLLNWFEDDTLLGNGSTLSTTLDRQGNIVIGLKSLDFTQQLATASVTLHVVEPADGPKVHITSPTNGFTPDWTITSACDFDALTCPITVTFTATASNADGTPISPSEIQWSDPQDGTLGTGASIEHTFTIPACTNSSASMMASVLGPNGLSTDAVIISFITHGC